MRCGCRLGSACRSLLKCCFTNYSAVQLQSTVLFAVIALEWILAYELSKHYGSFSKLSHYAKSDEDFLRNYDLYMESSLKAKLEMREWLRRSAPAQNGSAHRLFSSATKQGSLCVGVLSKKRMIGAQQPRYYLTQTLMSLLTRIPLKYQDRVRIVVYNVETNPMSHDELVELSDLVVYENVTARDATSVRLPITADSLTIPKIKEAVDYAIILKRLHAIDACDYFLTLEDDCIASFGWYEGVVDSLRQISSSYFFSDSWFCIKYFTSFRFFDWLLNPTAVVFFVVYAALFTLVQCKLFQLLLMNKCQQSSLLRYNRLNPDENRPLSVLCVHRRISFSTFAYSLITIHSVYLVFWLHSTSAQPIGSGLRLLSQGFNNVALVYPRKHMLGFAEFLEGTVVDFLNKRPFEPKDISSKKFRAEKGLYEFVYEPSLFQHAGLHSSLGYRSLTDISEIQYGVFNSFSYRDDGKPVIFDPSLWQVT